jgi:hypothetical protein
VCGMCVCVCVCVVRVGWIAKLAVCRHKEVAAVMRLEKTACMLCAALLSSAGLASCRDVVRLRISLRQGLG